MGEMFDNSAQQSAPSNNNVDNQGLQAAAQQPVNPLILALQNEGQAQQAGAEPQQQAAQVGELQPQQSGQDLILGKFKTVDDLANSYKNLEGFSTQTRQEVAQLKSLVDNYQNIIGMLQQQGQQPNQMQPEQAQVVEPQIDNEALLTQFYDDPAGTLSKMIEQKARELINPIQSKLQMDEEQKVWNQRAVDFGKSHPDAGQYAEEMKQALIQFPDLQKSPSAFDIAYNYVKGQKAASLDPANLAKDENFLNQYVLNNPDVKNRVLQTHMQSIQQNTPPPVLGNQVGGQQLGMPEQRPTTLQESTNLLLKALGLRR
jgi:hypothetical protein